jgi:hypothetical protein
MPDVGTNYILFRISLSKVVRLIILNLAVSFLLLLLTAIVHAIYSEGVSGTNVFGRSSVAYILGLFNLSSENTIASWYASMLLLLTSLLAIVCYEAEKRKHIAGHKRFFSSGWLIISVVFAMLSLDEQGSLHENAGKLASFDIIGDGSWQSVLAIPLLAFVIFMVVFAWLHLRYSRWPIVFLIAGAALFLSIPVQEHFEMLMWGRAQFSENWRRPIGFALLEEGSELLATLCFMTAMVMHLSFRTDEGTNVNFKFRATTLITRLSILLFFGFVLQCIFLSFRSELNSDEGIALNWFPAALAIVVITIIEFNSSLLPNRFLSVLFLILSMYFGINFYALMRWSELYFLPYVVGLIIAGGVASTVYTLYRNNPNLIHRLIIIFWAAAIVASLFIEHASIAILVYVAFSFFTVSFIKQNSPASQDGISIG